MTALKTMLRRDHQIRTQSSSWRMQPGGGEFLGGLPAARQSHHHGMAGLDPIPPDAFNNISTILIAFALIPSRR